MTSIFRCSVSRAIRSHQSKSLIISGAASKMVSLLFGFAKNASCVEGVAGTSVVKSFLATTCLENPER
jgi:hypothetical protein